MSKRFATETLRNNLVDYDQRATSLATSPLARPVGSLAIDTSPADSRLWSKTGGGATTIGWTINNVAQLRVFNIVDFGAVGDGVFDNDDAINLAIAAARTAGGGIVYIPPGDFAVYRPAPVGTFFNFQLTDHHDILFLGDGAASKLRMRGDANFQDYYMFWITDTCRRLAWSGISFFGNDVINFDQQTHILLFNGRAINSSGPRDMEVSGCYFNGQPGDSIRFLAEVGREVKDARVRCNFFDIPASRCGVQVQRTTGQVLINYNYFSGSDDNDIDFEPTAAIGPNFEYSIIGNQFLSVAPALIAISFQGDTQTAPLTTSTLAHNVIFGQIFSIALKNSVILGNVVFKDRDGSVLGTPLTMQRSINGVQITANVFRSTTVGSAFNITGLQITGQPGFMLPGRIVVSDCIAEVSRGDSSFAFDSVSNVVVTGCIAIVNPTAAGVAVAYLFRATDGINDGLQVIGCMATSLGGNLISLARFTSSPAAMSSAIVAGCWVSASGGIVRWERSTNQPFFGVRGAYNNLGNTATQGLEPPGSNPGAVISANLPPYALTSGQTLTISVNGAGAATTTFTCTSGARTGVAGTYPTGFTGGQVLNVSINGGANTAITFLAGDQLIGDVVNRVNAVIGAVALASNAAGQLRITSLRCGTASTVQVIGGSAAATLGMAVGTTAGTGNVADISATSSAEVATAVIAATAGSNAKGAIVGTTDEYGRGIPVWVWTTTLGSGGSIQVTGGTANPTIGFPTSVVQGGFLGAVVSGGVGARGPQMTLLFNTAGPEGEVVMPVGSLVLNASGGQDTAIWNKQVGTGRTGYFALGGYQIMFGAVDTDAAVTAARFLAPSADLALVGTAEIQIVMPRACTVRNIRLQCTAGVGAGTTTYTVRRNAASTTLVLTVNHTVTTGVSLTNPQAFAQGDRLSIQVTKSATPGTAQTNVSITLEMI
jgi:hypothetical protein